MFTVILLMDEVLNEKKFVFAATVSDSACLY